ncbi:MAG: hypothetical protein KH381_10220 [Clostridium sp.]|nr:hypothetical protein [Clostridium sp.]
MRDRFRRFVAALLAVFMIFQFPAGDGSGIGNEITQAFAATSAYNINLGTGVLQTGDGYQWSEAEGDTVYYGRGAAVANSGGMSYRVLKNNGSSMLLDCAQTYKYENHLSDYSEFGVWESSVPKEDMNSDIGSKLQLRDDEVSKLLNTVHPAENYTAEDGTIYTSSAGTDKVFMLSAEEAETYYADDSARAKGGAYWLRSTGSNKELTDANTYVAADGQIMTTRSGSYTASPAFQIDSSISSVLFTSTADGKETGLQQPEQVTNQKWVLTLLTAGTLELADEEVTVSVEADPAGDTDQTKTPAVFWSSAVTVENFEVADGPCQYSVLITDRAYTAANAKIKWYGRIKEIEGGDAETIAFRLPSDYETTDHVYLLAEKDFKNSLAEIYLSHATKPLEIDLGISRVAVDSEGTHLVTTDQEEQICYPKAGYQEKFEAVYTVEDGYYIPEDYAVEEQSGIQVTRLSSTQLKVSGIPTAPVVEIPLEAATKEEPETEEPTTELQPGRGSVTMADYYYGGTAPAPELKSETNGTAGVVVEYKKASEPDTAYTTKVPTQVGEYMIRATFPATESYAAVTAAAEFAIRYLPTPERAYSLNGTQGEKGYYTSSVTVVPAEGYLIADALDGDYAENLILTQDMEAGQIYLKKQATGEKTDGIAREAVLIDQRVPAITAVKDGETYYKDSVQVVISDKNLSRIQINDDNIVVKGTEMTFTLSSNHGSEDYQIIARDVAGNETKVSLTVAAPWMKKGIIPTGELIRLKSDRAYSFGDGTWQVEGDTTSYAGGRSFYVKKDGEYTFTKKN